MLVGIVLKHLGRTCVSMKFFVNHLVSILHPKIEFMNERIDNSLKRQEHYPFTCMFQSSFGLMQFHGLLLD